MNLFLDKNYWIHFDNQNILSIKKIGKKRETHLSYNIIKEKYEILVGNSCDINVSHFCEEVSNLGLKPFTNEIPNFIKNKNIKLSKSTSQFIHRAMGNIPIHKWGEYSLLLIVLEFLESRSGKTFCFNHSIKSNDFRKEIMDQLHIYNLLHFIDKKESYNFISRHS